MNFDRCTIYWTSDFMGNVQQVEARRATVEVKPYAQHTDAVHVRFVKKGGRSERGFVKGYMPKVWIVAGWNQPEAPDLFAGGEVLSAGPGVSVIKASRAAFDEGFEGDFRAMMEDAGVGFDFDSGDADSLEQARA